MANNKLKQPEGQDRNVFNGFKRTLRDISLLTDEQLAILHFETWHEARTRGDFTIAPDETE